LFATVLILPGFGVATGTHPGNGGMMQASPLLTEANMDIYVELLVKAQSGDEDARNELLARYVPKLKRWARGRLPAHLRTMLDTGDLVHDAIVNALLRLSSVEICAKGTVHACLRRAVTNCIDLCRHVERRPIREERPDNAVSDGLSPLDAVIGADDVAWYEGALANLSDHEQQAIFLSVELGHDFEEIAAQLGTPTPDAARIAVNRAIARLVDEMRRQR